MTQSINKEFDNIFNDIIDLKEKLSDNSVKERLDRASEFVLMAAQMNLLGKTEGIDLTQLGVQDDRKHGRRIGDRRHSS